MSQTVLDRMLAGGIIRNDEMSEVWKLVARAHKLTPGLNASTSVDEMRERLSELIGSTIDKSSTVFVPFHTNFGKHIKIGKNVFINHACSFLDLGGITTFIKCFQNLGIRHVFLRIRVVLSVILALILSFNALFHPLNFEAMQQKLLIALVAAFLVVQAHAQDLIDSRPRIVITADPELDDNNSLI